MESTTASIRRPSGGMFRPHWWAPGLGLHERPVPADAAKMSLDEDVRRRLDHWRAAYGPAGDGFAWRLAEAGLDEAALLGLLAEPPESLAARVARPGWASLVERVVAAAVPVPARLADSWEQALAVPLHPFVADACDRLLGPAGRPVAHLADLPAITEGFAGQLGRRLLRIAARTLLRELDLPWGVGGPARLADPRRLADLIARLAEPSGLARLFQKYPVLARLLGEASSLAAEAHLELLTRYAADRALVCDALLDGTEPGPIVAVRTGCGDRHQGGRSVAILSFADRRQIVYKPRGVRAQAHLAGLIGWLNEAVPDLGLKTVTTVDRHGYGWAEQIQAEPLRSIDEAERFYRRQGALLALLHAVRATDAHCENLIAVRDQPVLVDAETLFHPTLHELNVTPDPAAWALAESVHRTALLPSMAVVEDGVSDVSGLSGGWPARPPADPPDGDSSAADRPAPAGHGLSPANRPRLAGRDLDPTTYEGAILEGFRLGYDAIRRARDGFIDLMSGCADLRVRLIGRPTRWYVELLDDATHPDVLGDGLDRDRVLDRVWTASPRPPLRRLVRHEVMDLWAGDVPLFVARAAARDVWTSREHLLPDLLDQPGLDVAAGRVRAMDDADRQDQEWIISATLATRHRPVGCHRSTQSMPAPVRETIAEPGRLLAAACGLADQIVARSMTTGRSRVNWLGLELVDETQWLVLPMGAGLAAGYCGVALFLAQLDDIAGIGRYRDVARRAVSAVPQLLRALDQRPDLVRAVGPGGYYGLGGIGYALARLATLLSDADVQLAAHHAVELAAVAAADPSGPPDVAMGTAGLLAAATAVHAELDLDAAGRLARDCADRLVALVERTGGRCAADADTARTGFADGTAGIGWALARFAATGTDSRYARAGYAALRWTDPTGSPRGGPEVDPRAGEDRGPGWCAGTAGVVAARTRLAAGDPTESAATRRAVLALTRRPVLRDLSLCHGELGIVEALALLARRDRSVVRDCRRRVGLVLDAIERYGPGCGVPGSVPTPGLLSGLAGIGYELTRLAFVERVPSILLLDSTPGSAGRD